MRKDGRRTVTIEPYYADLQDGEHDGQKVIKLASSKLIVYVKLRRGFIGLLARLLWKFLQAEESAVACERRMLSTEPPR